MQYSLKNGETIDLSAWVSTDPFNSLVELAMAHYNNDEAKVKALICDEFADILAILQGINLTERLANAVKESKAEVAKKKEAMNNMLKKYTEDQLRTQGIDINTPQAQEFVQQMLDKNNEAAAAAEARIKDAEKELGILNEDRTVQIDGPMTCIDYVALDDKTYYTCEGNPLFYTMGNTIDAGIEIIKTDTDMYRAATLDSIGGKEVVCI